MKIDYAQLFTLRKDGRFSGHWYSENGQRHTICDKDPEALYWKIKAKEHPAPKTFQDMALAWQEKHVSKLSRGTQKTYKAPFDKLIEAFGDKPISEFGSADIDQLLRREKNCCHSYKTAALLRSVCKQICDYAIGEREITFNPVQAVHVPSGMPRGHVEAPDEDEEKIIKDNLDKPFGDFVALLLYTGMRTEEAVALTWDDIDLKHELINVNKAMDLHGTPKLKETKTEAGEREIPILPPLKPYLIKPKKYNGYVFNVEGKPLTRGQINSRWLNWCKAAGLAEQRTYLNRHRGERLCARTEWRPMIAPHQLRHYFATILYENNIDILTAKDLLGHKDIETTQKIYTSLRKKHKHKQFDALRDIFGGGESGVK